MPSPTIETVMPVHSSRKSRIRSGRRIPMRSTSSGSRSTRPSIRSPADAAAAGGSADGWAEPYEGTCASFVSPFTASRGRVRPVHRRWRGSGRPLSRPRERWESQLSAFLRRRSRLALDDLAGGQEVPLTGHAARLRDRLEHDVTRRIEMEEPSTESDPVPDVSDGFPDRIDQHELVAILLKSPPRRPDDERRLVGRVLDGEAAIPD